MARTVKNKRLTPKDRKAKVSAWWWDRAETAQTPSDRISAACDYLRSALSQNPGPEAASVATKTAAEILNHADKLMGVKNR
jgi:hypothetical protein